jgi:hypothetical protein
MFFFILKKNKNINVMIIDAVCLHRCPTHTTCFIIGVQQYKKNETAIPNMQDVSGQNHCHCLTKDLILHPFSSFALFGLLGCIPCLMVDLWSICIVKKRTRGVCV